MARQSEGATGPSWVRVGARHGHGRPEGTRAGPAGGAEAPIPPAAWAFRRAPPHLAGQAGRAGGASPRAPRRLADRTHPASPTPTPTPGARTEDDKAAPQRGRCTPLHLRPGAGSGGRAPGGGASGAGRGVVRAAAANRSAASGRPGRGAGLGGGARLQGAGRGSAALRVASPTSP